jgi:hypothetical protein
MSLPENSIDSQKDTLLFRQCRPTRGRVLILRDHEPEMIGSLHVPETAQKPLAKPVETGTVIKVGPPQRDFTKGDGAIGHPTQEDLPSPGDRVVFHPNYQHGDKRRVVVVTHSSLLAIL